MTAAAVRHLRVDAAGRLADATLLGEPRLREALDLLNGAGEETRLVGGAVRNALLDLPPGDIDLATTAVPGTVMARAAKARLRTIPTGLSHGTVTLMVGGRAFEVTTLREDVATDGRHAVVRFGRDFEADARRRDFTFNALSADPGGKLYDSVGGVADLGAGRVRFIGDARTRIREDYLRILRFFRFHAHYGLGPLDAEGLRATMAERDGLDRLSRERVRTEMVKLLGAARPVEALGAMRSTEILERVLGGPGQVERLARLTAVESGPPDPVVRLAALAAPSAMDADRLRAALRLSNAEHARLLKALSAEAAFPRVDAPPADRELRAALFAHGRAAAADGLLLRAADAGAAPAPAWRDSAGRLERMVEPVLPWSGADLASRGLKGPAVGAALAALRRAWADAGFPEDAAARAAVFEAAAGTPGAG